MNSRYYDSNICRFISPDSVGTLTTSLLGFSDKNLYAYCDNNPIMRSDDYGDFWLTSVAIGASIVGMDATIINSVIDIIFTNLMG